MDGSGAVGGQVVTWVSLQVAAERAGRDVRTVQRWVAQGRLTVRDNGTGRLVCLQDVLRVEADIRMRHANRQQQRMIDLLGEWRS